jgi:hypothetical protein
MEAIRSSETSVNTISTGRHIPEDGILYSHHRENLKSYKKILFYFNLTFRNWDSHCKLKKVIIQELCHSSDHEADADNLLNDVDGQTDRASFSVNVRPHLKAANHSSISSPNSVSNLIYYITVFQSCS